MTVEQDVLSLKIEQQARLIVQVANQVADGATAAKCNAAYSILIPKFLEILSLSDQRHTDLLALCYSVLLKLVWRGCEKLPSLAPFADQVAKPFGAFVRKHWEWIEHEDLCQNQSHNHLDKIAYISAAVQLEGANAISRVCHAFIAGHCEGAAPRPAITVFMLSEPDQAYLDTMNQLGVELVDLSEIERPSEQADHIVNHTRDHQINALICDEPNVVQTITFQRRAAPVQAIAEMGFAPWGIEGLDICLSGISQDPQSLAACCDTVVPTRRPVFRDVVDGKVDPGEVEKLQSDLLSLVPNRDIAPSSTTQNTLIFGFYGRLVKISPEYLKRVEQILLQLENSVFFIGGLGNADLIQAFLQASPVRSRIHFAHSFVDGHLISAVMDVFLDSEPFPGGVSCVECQIKSVPVIWKEGFGDQTIGLLADMRDPLLGAKDDADYISKALALAEPQVLEDAQKRALKVAEITCDHVGAARQIETALQAELDKL